MSPYTVFSGAPVPHPPTSPKPTSAGRFRPGSRGSRPGSGFMNVPSRLDIATKDQGRAANLPQCPMLTIFGKNSLL